MDTWDNFNVEVWADGKYVDLTQRLFLLLKELERRVSLLENK